MKRSKLLFFLGVIVLVGNCSFQLVNLVLYLLTGRNHYLYHSILLGGMVVVLSFCLLRLNEAIRELRVQQEKL